MQHIGRLDKGQHCLNTRPRQPEHRTFGDLDRHNLGAAIVSAHPLVGNIPRIAGEQSNPMPTLGKIVTERQNRANNTTQLTAYRVGILETMKRQISQLGKSEKAY